MKFPEKIPPYGGIVAMWRMFLWSCTKTSHQARFNLNNYVKPFFFSSKLIGSLLQSYEEALKTCNQMKNWDLVCTPESNKNFIDLVMRMFSAGKSGWVFQFLPLTP